MRRVLRFGGASLLAEWPDYQALQGCVQAKYVSNADLF